MVVIKLNCSLCHICAIVPCMYHMYYMCHICTICAISVPAAFVKSSDLCPAATLILMTWKVQMLAMVGNAEKPRWNLWKGVLGHRVKAWLFRRDWLKRRGWWKQETCVQSPPNQRSVAAKNQPQKIKSQKINCKQKFWAELCCTTRESF